MMRKPDFIIAGTQKGGTTWLEHNLCQHAAFFTPRKQLHFFDQNFDKGMQWYCSHFSTVPAGVVCGEKTTEYFDPANVDLVFDRIKECCPDTKIIVILREPVARATSALAHVVRSGLIPIPKDESAALAEDMKQGMDAEFRFVERGFYVDQLNKLEQFVPKNQILVLILEEDIVHDPLSGFRKVCSFLGVEAEPTIGLDRPVNQLRLSKLALNASRWFYKVPFARGLIRAVDKRLNLKHWEPEFSDDVMASLERAYAAKNIELFEYLGRPIPSWER